MGRKGVWAKAVRLGSIIFWGGDEPLLGVWRADQVAGASAWP